MKRRPFLLFLLSLALPATARAQAAWPSRPITLIVGFDPGGGVDFTARTIQGGLEAALGQPVVIEYRAGAGGVLAASELARAKPDGYTLLLANTGPFVIAPALLSPRPYDALAAFSWVGQITEAGYIAATHAEHPAQDLAQFVAWARAQAEAPRFASSGTGTSTHLNGELLARVAGVALRHVPFKGSAPAVTELIGGHVQLLIDSGTVLLPHIKAGRVKALAVTGARREPQLASVATVREQGLAGLESAGFQGLVGPAGLPREVVQRLDIELRKVLGRADVRAEFAAAGSEVRTRGPQEFAAHVGAEAQRWAALIAQRDIKAD